MNGIIKYSDFSSEELDLVNEDWKKMFSSIEKYISQRKYIDRSSEIIFQGLSAMLSLPGSNCASLFLMKENSFEFEYRASVPPNNKEKAKQIYSLLIENGNIGLSLETGNLNLSTLSIDGKDQDYVITVPLPVSWGIVGMVLLHTDNPIENYNQMLLKLCSLQGNLFAGTLESSILFKNLGTAKAVLEQKVSVRTMDLAQSQREMKAILDSVQTGILVLDSDTNKVVKVNPVALDLIKDFPANIIGNDSSKYLEYIDFSKMPGFSSSGTSKNFESYLISSSGERVPVIRTVSTVNLGFLKYRIESFLDITERKCFETELQKANELLEMKVQERTLDLQLLVKKLKEEIDEREQAQSELKKMLAKEKELNEMKTRFVSMVSHEFRTPLTVIRSAAQMLNKFRDKLNDTEREEYLHRVVKTVDSMTDLIENVIFIGKQEAERGEPAPTLLDLEAFFDNVIKDFSISLLKPRAINMNTIGNAEPVFTNEKLLRLIVTNLLSNASKYSPTEKPVEVSLYCNQDSFTFTVKDYGIGIPEPEQESIFKLFYRADNVGAISGTGIGMPVIMNSVQILKGKINLDSRVNQGTAVTITIPHIKFGAES